MLCLQWPGLAQAADPPAPYGPVPSARQLKWHALGIYGFVHFSVNTFTDREWGNGDESPQVFNPTDFSADQIVSAAQAGGLKGLILTAKHHDGFCLWPTKTTEHNITKSPYRGGQGDIVREMAEACRRRSLKFGIYVSPWDRNHADYGQEGYVRVYHEQIRELATGYGPLFEMWFDGANGGSGYYGGKRGKRRIDGSTYYQWDKVVEIIRAAQPECVIWGMPNADARWGGSEQGFVGDPCWSTVNLPAPESQFSHGHRNGKHWLPAEADVSIRPGWFYHEHEDAQVKSADKLKEIYFQSIGRGANLILNIPPDRRGRIHERDVAALRDFKSWSDATFGNNLAAGATFQASQVRGGDETNFGPARLLDANPWSAWATDDNVTEPNVILTLRQPVKFNVIRLREDIRSGQRIEGVAVDAKVDGQWREIAAAQNVGACRLIRIPAVTTQQVRVRITKSPVCPMLSDVGLFLEPAAASTPPVAQRPNSATRPSPGNVRWFMRNHASNLQQTKTKKFEICVLGDSITAMWPGDLLGKYFGKYPTVNFGIGGDRTENVLWRLDKGELNGTSPKLIVLLIGTNNMGFNSAEEIAEGVGAVVANLRVKLPATKILLVGIFPKRDAPLPKITAANALIAKLDDGKAVRYRDIGAQFLDKDGKILPGILTDAVHLSHKGYEIWGNAMAPLLAEIMADDKPAAGAPNGK
jgi:alpha-L-fucosidase/lysophospholipase L1-like esterase